MDTSTFRRKRRMRLFRDIAEDSGFGREPKTPRTPTKIWDPEHVVMGHDTERNPLPEESMTHVRNPLRTKSPSSASAIGKPPRRVETPALGRHYDRVTPGGHHPMAQKNVSEPTGSAYHTGRAGTKAPNNLNVDPRRTKTLSHYPSGGASAGRATNPLQEVLAPRRRKIFALDPNYRPTTKYNDSRGEKPAAAAAPADEGTAQTNAARGKPASALSHYQEGPSQTGVAGPPDTQVVGSQVGRGGKFAQRRAGQRAHRARLFAGARQGSGFYQEGSPA